MTKAIYPVVLGAALSFGVAAAPSFAGDAPPKAGKTAKIHHKKPARAAKKTAPIVNPATQNDYYTAEREKQLKPDM
jgi:hypothetical protein